MGGMERNPKIQTEPKAKLNQKSSILSDLRIRAFGERTHLKESTDVNPVSIVICDDNRLFVEGIASLIEHWEEFALSARVFSYHDLISTIKDNHPAVVLLGARVDNQPCAPIIEEILKASASTCIMVLSSHEDASEVLAALRAGAMGYGLRNDLSVDRLRGIIWGMVCGEVVFDGSIRSHLQSYLLESDNCDSDPSSDSEQGLVDLLTRREREVLRLLIEGYSNQEVASTLFISEPTVKKTVSRIIYKLQVQNRVQAAVYGAKHLKD